MQDPNNVNEVNKEFVIFKISYSKLLGCGAFFVGIRRSALGGGLNNVLRLAHELKLFEVVIVRGTGANMKASACTATRSTLIPVGDEALDKHATQQQEFR